MLTDLGDAQHLRGATSLIDAPDANTQSEFWVIFTHGSSRATERRWDHLHPDLFTRGRYGLGSVISPGKGATESFSFTVHGILCLCVGPFNTVIRDSQRSKGNKAIDS